MFNHHIDPKAQEDIENSFDWYLQRSIPAAEGFLTELDEVIGRICLDPQMWPSYEEGLREMLMERYPYTVVYLVDEQARSVIIISVFHQSRHPKGKYRPEP
jgi:plasmid stabilization system protein ParE